MLSAGCRCCSCYSSDELRRTAGQAVSIADHSNYRHLLQGVNLASPEVALTDGKQLLHLPCVLSLVEDVISEMITLQVWGNRFQIEIGNFSWSGSSGYF